MNLFSRWTRRGSSSSQTGEKGAVPLRSWSFRRSFVGAGTADKSEMSSLLGLKCRCVPSLQQGVTTAPTADEDEDDDDDVEEMIDERTQASSKYSDGNKKAEIVKLATSSLRKLKQPIGLVPTGLVKPIPGTGALPPTQMTDNYFVASLYDDEDDWNCSDSGRAADEKYGPGKLSLAGPPTHVSKSKGPKFTGCAKFGDAPPAFIVNKFDGKGSTARKVWGVPMV